MTKPRATRTNPETGDPERWCTSGHWAHVEDFGKRAASPDGLNVKCRPHYNEAVYKIRRVEQAKRRAERERIAAEKQAKADADAEMEATKRTGSVMRRYWERRAQREAT